MPLGQKKHDNCFSGVGTKCRKTKCRITKCRITKCRINKVSNNKVSNLQSVERNKVSNMTKCRITKCRMQQSVEFVKINFHPKNERKSAKILGETLQIYLKHFGQTLISALLVQALLFLLHHEAVMSE